MPFLKNTLENLMMHAHLGFKIIICEDSSTDGTKDLLRSLEEEYITIVQSPKRISLAENWTKGISLVRTKYLKLLCADDEFSIPFAIEAVEIMEKNESLIATTGRSRVIDPVTRSELIFKISAWPCSGRISCRRTEKLMVAAGRNIFGAPSAVIFRTSKLVQVMPWDGQYPYLIDVATYLKLLRRFKDYAVYFSTETASVFRLTPGSISDANRKSQLKQWRKVVLRREEFGTLEWIALFSCGFILSMCQDVMKRGIYTFINFKRKNRGKQNQSNT